MLSTVLAITLAAATGSPNQPARAPAGADEAALQKLEQSFEEAFNRKDVAALMAYYADDAVLMDPGPQLWLKGKEAIRASFQAMVAQPGTMKLHLHDKSYRVVGDLGYGTALWTMTVTSPDGQSSELKGRASVVFEKRGGQWQAVVDHASMPMPPPPPAPDAKGAPAASPAARPPAGK